LARNEKVEESGSSILSEYSEVGSVGKDRSDWRKLVSRSTCRREDCITLETTLTVSLLLSLVLSPIAASTEFNESSDTLALLEKLMDRSLQPADDSALIRLLDDRAAAAKRAKLLNAEKREKEKETAEQAALKR